MLLREARLAHSRKDFDAEREPYLQVLDVLNSEDYYHSDPDNPTDRRALTGDPRKDEQLRKLISVLLRR